MKKIIPEVTSSEAMAALVNKLATLNDKDSQYLLGIGVGLAMAKRTEENKDNN